jgi:N-acetylglutamate synthase
MITDKGNVDIQICPLTMDDYDQVLGVWQRCPGVGINDADTRERTEAYLKRNPGMSFVALARAAVVGTALCGHDGRRGYLNHLAVLESFRGRGIGRQLVERCLQSLKKGGISKCHLFVFHRNESAIRFWEKTGWTVRRDLELVSRRTGRAPRAAGRTSST